MENEHKRRKHYAGKYPKNFEEKYKELDPEKYAGTREHVMEKGGTPAGMHISVMVNEVLENLCPAPGQTGLDATLGYGGHTEKILEKLAGRGHLTSLDIDPEESVKTEARLRKKGYSEEILTVRHMNFREIGRLPEETGLFDFVLADLGVSSMQIDNPARGFSYKADGPLDLRMNNSCGQTGAERLAELSEEEICGMLLENSDEPYAAEIAAEIIRERKSGKKILTTKDLRNAVEAALSFVPPSLRKDAVKKSCQRVFQALRIDVNSEFEALYDFLESLPSVLKPGGRAVILTFHSGEDRLVKKSFRELRSLGVYAEISQDVIRPSEEECRKNSRARSTKLRFAVKA